MWFAVRQEVAQNTDNWPVRIPALPLPMSHDRLRGDEVEFEKYPHKADLCKT
jgi:hypothetical protein